MTERYQHLKAYVAILPGVVAGLIAGISPLVWGLFYFQLIDIVSGLIAAKTSWSSAFANAGMQKKTMMWLYVLTGHLLKTISPIPIDFPVDAMIAGYYCVVEVISIMENGAKLGLDAPGPLKKIVTIFTRATIQEGDVSVTLETKEKIEMKG
ncbi:MAG: phage holin family protein [Alphaproteobacteria bacterium]